MSYRIEVAADRYEGFYLEIVMVNIYTKQVMPAVGIDHRLIIGGDRCDDYGWTNGRYSGQVIASNANGLITAPALGVVAINVPGSAFNCYGSRDAVLRGRLLAVPDINADFTKTIADMAIYLGARQMAGPRVQLNAIPLYPTGIPGTPFIAGSVQVAQVKRQLVTMSQYDAVEAALAGPTDPATISWNSGGTIDQTGPLAEKIAEVLSYNETAMAYFLFTCSQITL